MRKRPLPGFIATILAAVPADGSAISARGVFLAVDRSTPAYVRIVLRELVRTGQLIASGPAGQRLYRRPVQVPVGGEPIAQGDTIHECA